MRFALAATMKRALLHSLLLVAAVSAAPDLAAAEEDPASAGCACDVTAAACDEACSCDPECAIDWEADECGEAGAECAPEVQLDDAAVLALEEADVEDDDDLSWAIGDPALVECPQGASSVDGACLGGEGASSSLSGGCNAPGAGGSLLLGIVALALLLLLRRAAPALLFLSCLPGPEVAWDEAVSEGPPEDAAGEYHSVLAGELRDGYGARYSLAHQPLDPSLQVEPAPAFSLARAAGGGSIAIARLEAVGCGDHLIAGDAEGGELLGWAASEPEDGTAPLVAVSAPDGCAQVHETDPDAVALLVAEGWRRGPTLGHVWPPDWGRPDPSAGDEDAELEADAALASALPAPCNLRRRPALILHYAGVGNPETHRLLRGCPGEVVVGEKDEGGPRGLMRTRAAQRAGGRSGFVLGHHGEKIRSLLRRSNGVERTARYLRKKLAAGYDYIIIDEITAHPDWRDGSLVNRRFRRLLHRLPRRKVIAYVSIDLTTWPGGDDRMRERRLLLRALKKRSRAIALEVYLDTGQVMNRAAPSAFRTAANRLSSAVRGLSGVAGINRRAITSLAISIRYELPAFRYLTWPANDLESLRRQAKVLRRGSRRLRAQRGIGFYHIGKNDITPWSSAPYSYDRLIGRLNFLSRRFR